MFSNTVPNTKQKLLLLVHCHLQFHHMHLIVKYLLSKQRSHWLSYATADIWCIYSTIVCPELFLLGPSVVLSNSEVSNWNVTRLHLQENVQLSGVSSESREYKSHATCVGYWCSQCLRARSHLCSTVSHVLGTEYGCIVPPVASSVQRVT